MNPETAPARSRAAAARGRQAQPAQSRHEGIHYLKFLKRVAELAQPTAYLEIGTRHGKSLESFDCDAICIDPIMRPRPESFNRRRTFCFQMSSDAFFHETDVLSIFPQGVDIAFLDGMHRFEYLLRDFINVERCCHERSLVLLHDCFPNSAEVADRICPGGAWAGDVWKLVPILKELREDLVLARLDCPPTGLFAVQNVARDSSELSSRYHEIVQQYGTLSLEDYGIDRLWADVEAIESRQVATDESVWSLHLPTF